MIETVFSAIIAFILLLAAFALIALPFRLAGPLWRRMYRHSTGWKRFNTMGSVRLIDGTTQDGVVMARQYRGQVQYRRLNEQEDREVSEERLWKATW